MELKDVLVSIDATRHGSQRLQLAMRLARRHKAHLTGYYVSPTVGSYAGPAVIGREGPLDLGRPKGPETTSAADLAEAIELQFARDLRLHSLTGDWLLSAAPVLEDIIDRVRTADLAVIGLGDPDRSSPDPQGFRSEEIILRAGRPVLGVPIANVPEDVGANTLIAWDGSRPASRALNDALPLLTRARSVTVLSVEPDERTEWSLEAAVRHLHRHDVTTAVSRIIRGDFAVGDAILADCEHLGADLIVAGAYGHSRLRESVLGGVSQTLLRQMMVPVLMSH